MTEFQQVRLSIAQIDTLVAALAGRGFKTYGPVVRDGVVTYDEIAALRDLPQGVTDTQEPGRYRLNSAGGAGPVFGYTLGVQSWKKFLHPAQVKLFEAQRDNGAFRILDNPEQAARGPAAFVGVRACELAAIEIQDRVLTGGPYRDALYASLREQVFLVAVECTRSAATCFCASMGTGPSVDPAKADLTLTEVQNGGEHWFLARAGTTRGAEVLAGLGGEPVAAEQLRQAEASVAAAASQQTRSIDPGGIREVFHAGFEHPRWEEVAGRCLACANCTMVCPTCFCTTMEDTSDITGRHAERWRRWDSCFTTGFSYIHGGSVRTSGKARYRQWITHKLAAWIDQFGTSGCVGCGRCITWCPAGIDITEEARALRGAANHGNTNS